MPIRKLKARTAVCTQSANDAWNFPGHARYSNKAYAVLSSNA